MSDAAAEYFAVRQHVGLIDRSDLGIIEVTGRDRSTFLHAMLSNDVKSVGAGHGTTAAFLDVHGKVQTLLIIWALDDRLIVLTPPGEAAKAIQALDRYLFSEKAYLKDITGELGLLMLAGPEAAATLARVSTANVPDAPWSHVTTSIAGVEARVVRGAAETDEVEFWIAVVAAETERVRTALIDAGAGPVGRAAWESLRIEAGTPAYGPDVDETVLLPEIPLAPLVSYTKGCYIGQEVVVRIRDRGHVNRHLRGLVIDGATPPPPGAPVLADGAEIGRITSAAWSYGRQRPVALAFVRRQHAEPGTRVSVRVENADVPATVSMLPLARSS